MRKENYILIRDGDHPVIELHGEMDSLHTPHILSAVKNCLSGGRCDISIDCSAISSLDCDSVSVLSEAFSIIESSGGRLRLLSPTDHLLDHLQGAGLGACITPEPTSKAANWQESCMVITSRLDQLASVRGKIAKLASTMPFSEEEIEDIKLSVGEAATNAVKHGSPNGDSNKVTIRCERKDDRLVVHISDEGHGFNPDSCSASPFDTSSEKGRGIFFMQMLMDRLSFCFENGTTVRLEKLLSSI